MKTWQVVVAEKIDSMDLSIVATIAAIIFYMKYDVKSQHTGHKYIAIALGVGFVMLIGFRIYRGL